MTSLRCVVASILAAAAIPASAADWRLTPTVTSGLDFIDNPRLVPDVNESYAGARADASVQLAVNTEVSSIEFVPRFLYAHYPNDHLLDRRDTYITLSGKRLFETVTWQGSLGYTRDTTITSEFGLTGFQDVNRDHEAFTVSLGPTWSLSDRFQVGANAYGLDTRYIDAERTGLTDYTYALVGINATYVLSENLTGGLQASMGELDVPAYSREDQDIDASVSLDWRMTEHWSGRVSYGPTRVKSMFGSSNGHIYSLSVAKQLLRSNLRISAERDVTPTGRGVLVTRDEAALSFSYWLTPRTTWSLSTRVVQTTDAVRVAGVAEQTNQFASLESSVRWQFAERWSVVVTAGGRYLRYEERDEDADGFNVSLGLSWNGQPHAMAR